METQSKARNGAPVLRAGARRGRVMRVLVLAGLFTAVTAPMAMASENTIDCQMDDTRRASAEQRLDTAPPPAPATTVARPTVAQAQPAETPRPATERRRNGKRVPDAELIAPRGVL
jgi:hypothetical protein